MLNGTLKKNNDISYRAMVKGIMAILRDKVSCHSNILHVMFNPHFCYYPHTGPVEASVERFWSMVWQYKLQTIVMLTECVEAGKVYTLL